jgi:hypothetical protein
MYVVNLDFTGRSGHLVCAVQERSSGVSARSGDRADGWARRIVGVGSPRSQVVGAAQVVPIGTVVAQNSEVGSPHNLQVVGQARMSDGEIVGGQVGGQSVRIDERSVRVV